LPHCLVGCLVAATAGEPVFGADLTDVFFPATGADISTEVNEPHQALVMPFYLLRAVMVTELHGRQFSRRLAATSSGIRATFPPSGCVDADVFQPEGGSSRELRGIHNHARLSAPWS